MLSQLEISGVLVWFLGTCPYLGTPLLRGVFTFPMNTIAVLVFNSTKTPTYGNLVPLYTMMCLSTVDIPNVGIFFILGFILTSLWVTSPWPLLSWLPSCFACLLDCPLALLVASASPTVCVHVATLHWNSLKSLSPRTRNFQFSNFIKFKMSDLLFGMNLLRRFAFSNSNIFIISPLPDLYYNTGKGG